MRAKVQGSVWLECIVMPDGSVGDVKVTRSLDPIFGLDQEAIKAAKQWRFRPGHAPGRAGTRDHHDRADVYVCVRIRPVGLVRPVGPSGHQATRCYHSRMMRMLFAVCCLALSVDAFAQPQRFRRPLKATSSRAITCSRAASGLPEVKIHYRTVGTPRKDADGVVRNGVLILHGTGGSGARLPGRHLRRPVVRQGPAARRGEVLHHPSRQRRPRPVEQAERWPAHEVPEVSLHRHGASCSTRS